ncbi:hypothetical protein COOONC_03922, partial [Cooperia oncophora]
MLPMKLGKGSIADELVTLVYRASASSDCMTQHSVHVVTFCSDGHTKKPHLDIQYFPGRLHQVDYAVEAMKQGSATVGIKSSSHAVLAALK